MGLSKTQSICILLAIDTAFFLLEIIVGYAVHSLALVADAFHMFNDILSLLVGLWAVRVATNGKTSKIYTYGWQRAETLGALVNGVFLVALCVTIVLEAIQRFVDPPEIENPRLVLIVGSCGLASNIFGLLLFHEHGHGHSHGHSHDHGHSTESSVEEGRAEHEPRKGAIQGEDESTGAYQQPLPTSTPSMPINSTAAKHDVGEPSPRSVRRRSSGSRPGRRSSASMYGFSDAQDIPTTARAIRQSVIQYGSIGADHIREDPVEQEEDDTIYNQETSETSPLMGRSRSGHTSGNATKSNGQSHEDSHDHSDGPKHGGGHSHADLNMRGVFLHVLGDALGNIGVIASALFIWLTKFSWRFYADPLISLIITVIILCSAIPLCRATSRILLQGVPPGINIDAIKEDVEGLEHVVSCHHLHVWQLSDTKLIASLHIQIEFKPESDEDPGIQYDRARKLYMGLAKDIHLLLHDYGIASSTIQPEFCTDTTHRHLVSRESGDLTMVGDADESNGIIVDPAETCLLECDASCGNSISGQCCEPSNPTGGSSCGGGSPASPADV